MRVGLVSGLAVVALAWVGAAEADGPRVAPQLTRLIEACAGWNQDLDRLGRTLTAEGLRAATPERLEQVRQGRLDDYQPYHRAPQMMVHSVLSFRTFGQWFIPGVSPGTVYAYDQAIQNDIIDGAGRPTGQSLPARDQACVVTSAAPSARAAFEAFERLAPRPFDLRVTRSANSLDARTTAFNAGGSNLSLHVDFDAAAPSLAGGQSAQGWWRLTITDGGPRFATGDATAVRLTRASLLEALDRPGTVTVTASQSEVPELLRPLPAGD